MSYVVLARKYRPQDFDALVGQPSVAKTLQNAIESNRVAHAYVFSGPRGVGKTTTARILAKCLNCQSGPTVHPCNKCPSCTAITDGSSMQDVLEIDGASNRGIEQIRDLRDNAKYAPTSSRYRIFIIDEAHQITKDAFGALLKTLEEPPSHVVFMMATTEVQKIPAPILSRCQRFTLRPIAPELVSAHLKTICEKEKIKIDDGALADIVRFVEGSLRDALSLLDQALVYAPDGVNTQTLRDLLGLLPRETVAQFAAVLSAGDPATILKHITSVLKDGVDLGQLGKDLQAYFHELLLLKAGVKDAFTKTDAGLEAAAQATDFYTLERNIRLLSKALNEMRYSDTPRAIFEIYAIKIGQKILDPRMLLDALEKAGPVSPALPPVLPQKTYTAPKTTSALEPRETFIAKPKEPPVPFKKPEAAPAAAPLEENTGMAPATLEAIWPTVANDIIHQKTSLEPIFKNIDVSFFPGRIKIVSPKKFEVDSLLRIKPLIQEKVREHLNQTPDIDIQQGAAKPGALAERTTFHPTDTVPTVMSREPEPDIENVAAQDAPGSLKNALKYFSGDIKRMKPPAP